VISIKKQLVLWALILFTAVGIVAGAISYFLARADANALLDHQLALVAGSVDEGSLLPSMRAHYLGESDEERKTDFVIQVWYEKFPERTSHPDFELAKAETTGYSDLFLQDEKWRAYTIVYPDRTVQVSQAYAVRSKIALSAALRALLPVVGLIPLSWLLIVFGVGRILKPLDEVTRAATQRDGASLAPLPAENIPAEVAPLVTEMNGLILRVKETIDAQRNFTMDAAHELRTPLAALQLQIENLSQNHSPQDLAIRVEELKAGIGRASHLVVQLLHMARYGAERETVRNRMDLGELVKSCIGDFIPVAEKRGLDLGLIRDETACIVANEDDLRVLFNNLLDNAIRYTQRGGRIDVAVIRCGAQATVEIADNGPGIPESLLPRVFDRFYRVEGSDAEGSGIGLSIVNAIARQESAKIELGNRTDGRGLIVQVSFELPMQPLTKCDERGRSGMPGFGGFQFIPQADSSIS
jgi:two-component system, OmpR family, sensor kinase